MLWKKLNVDFDADPNSPMPRIFVDGTKVQVRFCLNAYIWDDVEEDDEAVLTFHDVHLYRLGRANDHGFYLGQCRFSGTGIKWGDFYELSDSNWQNDFPEDRVVVSPAVEGLKHFLLYFRDETFECVARSFAYERV